MKLKILLLLLFVVLKTNGQDTPLRVETKDIPNRLAFYAVNENEQDFDVQIKISGTNFRQSQGRPRWVRVPAASKVHLKTIVLARGKRPNYTYDLLVNDSLSRRALKKEFERIKIKPKKSITLYITDGCLSCDSIIDPLDASNYKYIKHLLSEKPEIRDQLKSYLPAAIDSIKTPILNIGGRLFTQIESYDKLLAELNKD
ncbi:MAG: glutaredoxin domain-containing protein [Maribacter sp.]|uniref:glutaredoxin domain-containing protein n=1 Tax=Maribacter sp. TaxID=1897614 RepID=UPI003297583B